MNVDSSRKFIICGSLTINVQNNACPIYFSRLYLIPNPLQRNPEKNLGDLQTGKEIMVKYKHEKVIALNAYKMKMN